MAIEKKTLIKTAILCCLVAVTYANSLTAPFEFDDWHVIPQNPSVRGPSDIPRFFTDVSAFSILPGNRDYRPLFLSSMALSWWVGNGSTIPFHIVGISLHLGCVLLVFFVLRRVLLTSPKSSEGLDAEEAGWAGFLGAALFAVHPLATEAVTYISSQSIPLAAFFYLSAFMLFLGAYAVNPSPTGAGKWLRVAASGALYFCALLSKPIAVTFPLVLLWWEILLGRDTDGSKWQGWSPQRLWFRARKHFTFAAITMVFLYLRGTVAGNPVSSTTISKGGPEILVHYLTQTKALALFYLRLALLPFGQNHDVEFPVARSFADPWFLLAAIFLGALAWLLWRWRKQRVLVFWALWFPTCLLVTTYLIQLGQRVREARMYLSLVGVCAVAAILTLMVWKRLPIRISDTTIGVRSGRRFLTATIVVVVAALGTATVGRNALWSSSLELWGNSARDGGQGTWRAHMNYALALENAGRAEEALVEFKNAVERGPYAWAYLNLGLAQVRRGLAEEGETNLRRAVSLWPDSPETNYYLGVGLMRLGKVDEAEQSFKHSLELRSNYLLAYRSLGQLYEQQGQVEQAIASYQKLVELDPGQAAAVDRIDKLRENGGDVQALAVFREAFAAQRDGRRDETIRLYEDLLKIDPRHRQGNFNLAFAYLDGTTPEDWKRAADLFGRVLEIDPNYTEAAHRLATAYGRLGERDEAVRWDKHYLQGETHPALADLSRRRLAALGESEE